MHNLPCKTAQRDGHCSHGNRKLKLVVVHGTVLPVWKMLMKSLVGAGDADDILDDAENSGKQCAPAPPAFPDLHSRRHVPHDRFCCVNRFGRVGVSQIEQDLDCWDADADDVEDWKTQRSYGIAPAVRGNCEASCLADLLFCVPRSDSAASAACVRA